MFECVNVVMFVASFAGKFDERVIHGVFVAKSTSVLNDECLVRDTRPRKHRIASDNRDAEVFDGMRSKDIGEEKYCEESQEFVFINGAFRVRWRLRHSISFASITKSLLFLPCLGQPRENAQLRNFGPV